MNSAPMLILTFVSGLLWLGFVLHTSGGDKLLFGKYTPTYITLLTFITLFWLLLLWWGWRRRKQLSGILLTISLNLLLTALLLAFILPSIYIYMHHRSLNNSLLKPLDAQAHAFFQIDQAPQLPKTNQPGSIKILTLGGSTTYGPRLKREQAYPAVLERLLKDRYPHNYFEVFNAGVPWHTSMHSLLRYVGIYSSWKPNMVIVMHAFNDIFQTSEGKLTTGRYREDYGHFFGALGERVNPKDQFMQMVTGTLKNNWFARTWYSDLYPAESIPDTRQVDLLRSLPSFQKNLSELVTRIRNDGAIVVLLTQPSLYQDKMSEKERQQLFYDFYYKDYAIVPPIKSQLSAMETFNQSVREIAETHHALLVDLEHLFPKSSEFMYDDVHYTVKGAEKVAKEIADRVLWSELRNRVK